MRNFVKTIIDGITAIKPYYYFRNGLLHVRYTVDKAIQLTEAEEKEIKNKFAHLNRIQDKQEVLADMWYILEHELGRTIYQDGIEEVGKRIQEAKNDISC